MGRQCRRTAFLAGKGAEKQSPEENQLAVMDVFAEGFTGLCHVRLHRSTAVTIRATALQATLAVEDKGVETGIGFL